MNIKLLATEVGEMRAIGLVFMVTGLVLACMDVHYTLRSATEEQSYREKYADYQAKVARYYVLKTISPYVPYPAYPREAKWYKAIERRPADAHSRFDALAGSRTGTQTLRDASAGLLMQWFLHGRR